MITVDHISQVEHEIYDHNAELVKTTTEQAAGVFNSCRFCTQGRGIYKVKAIGKTFYLCEKHKAGYDEEKDSV